MTTNITLAHREVFSALTSGIYHNFALFSCFVSGEPAAAIVAIRQEGGIHRVQPLFVSVTPNMMILDHDGISPT